jgi:hypothetical protein
MGLNFGSLVRSAVPAVGGALRGSNEREAETYRRSQLEQARRDQQQRELAALTRQSMADYMGQQRYEAEQAQSQANVEQQQKIAQYLAETGRMNAEKPPAETIKPFMVDGQPQWGAVPRGGDPRLLGDAPPPPPRAGGAGGDGKMPWTARDAIATNNSTLRAIGEALNAVRANPGAVGPKIETYVPDIFRKPFESAEENRVRAPIADVGSLQIKDRTGAVMAIREEPRLAPFVPDIRDKPEITQQKMMRLARALEAYNAEIVSGYGGGSPPASPSTEPTVPLEDRIAELRAQGIPKEEARQILLREGYDLQ